MGDRLQRILAKQQEHERRMRERDMVKAAFEAPPREVVNRPHTSAPPTATEPPTPVDTLDEVVGQSRWKKSEYGWSQLDDSRGSASTIRATSRESNSYIAPVTYTFLPTKDYDLLDIRGALERPADFAIACNVLEVLMRQYYITTLLSTQNKMYTDIKRANALLSSSEHQARPNYRSALFLFRTSIRVLYEAALTADALKNDNASIPPMVWLCVVCSYPGNSMDSQVCTMCSTRKPDEDDGVHEVPTTETHATERSPVGGTLARLQKERQEIEERTRIQHIKEDEQPIQEVSDQEDVRDNLGKEEEQQAANEEAAAQAKLREEEEMARERERKGSHLRARHENRIREIVRMFLTQSNLASQMLTVGDGINYFQNLPEEVIAYIFTFILGDLGDMNSIHTVCRQWHDIVGDDHLCKELTRIHFPHMYTSVLRNSSFATSSQEGNWKKLYIKLLYEENKNSNVGLAWCGSCGDVWWRCQKQCGLCLAALPRPLPPHLVPKALVTRQRPAPVAVYKEGYYY